MRRLQGESSPSRSPFSVGGVCEPLRVAVTCRSEALLAGGDDDPTDDRPACHACLLSHRPRVAAQHSFCPLQCSYARQMNVHALIRRRNAKTEEEAWKQISLADNLVLSWTPSQGVCQPLPLTLPRAGKHGRPALFNLTVECADGAHTAAHAATDSVCPLPERPVECTSVNVTPTPELTLGNGRHIPLQQRQGRHRSKKNDTDSSVPTAASPASANTPASGSSSSPSSSSAASMPSDSMSASHASLSLSSSGDSTPAAVVYPRKTILFVAHPDDSIIFQSPTLLQDLRDGVPVRSVFLTAGDNAGNAKYWKGREQGFLASIAYMVQSGHSWTGSTLTLNGHPLQRYTLDNCAFTVEVIFMRLPDGNLDGSGTSTYGQQSLMQLWYNTMDPSKNSALTSMTCVDRTTSYDFNDLTATLTALMEDFEPTYVAIQDHLDSGAFDHRDHVFAAKFVELAHRSYSRPHRIDSFQGYYTIVQPQNVFGDTLTTKQNAFFTYAAHDAQVCGSLEACKDDTYLTWMGREYKSASSSTLVLVADAGQAQTVVRGSDVQLDGSGSYDQESRDLTYCWKQIEGPMVSLSSTDDMAPTFTAPSRPTSLLFKLTVNNGLITSSASTVRIEVTPALPPTAQLTLAQQRVQGGSTVTLSALPSTDPASLPLTYLWTQTSGTAVTLSSATAVAPTFTAPVGNGELWFTLVVSNGETSDQTTAKVETYVLAPVAKAGDDVSVLLQARVILSAAQSTDPAGLPLSYQWTQVSGTGVTLSSPASVSPTFLAPNSPDTLRFQVTVSNGHMTATAQVTVQVTRALPPTASVVLQSQRVTARTIVELSGAPSTDPANLHLSFLWTQSAGAAVTLSAPSSALTTFEAPAANTELEFTLRVSNGQSDSLVKARVSVSVLPPVANAGDEQLVLCDTVFHLSGEASHDLAGLPLSFTWTQVGGPSAALLSQADGVGATVRAPSCSVAPAVLTFSVSVSNGVQLASETVRVRVALNAALTATATASSEARGSGQLAAAANDGAIEGYQLGDHTHEWASSGEKSGAWLQLDWTGSVTAQRVVLFDRPNQADHITAGVLTFSDGSEVPFGPLSKPRDPATADERAAAGNVTFVWDGVAVSLSPAKTVSWMRVTVTAVGPATTSVGLAEVQVLAEQTQIGGGEEPPASSSSTASSSSSSSSSSSTGAGDDGGDDSGNELPSDGGVGKPQVGAASSRYTSNLCSSVLQLLLASAAMLFATRGSSDRFL